jgi:4'-phosphopantetheinyl transferase EntD
MGVPAYAIPKDASGAPIWPRGIIGSLAHDDSFAVAAIAPSQCVTSIGIDIEADEALGTEIVNLVATPNEQRRYPPTVLNSRRLFVVKEAVYKATFPVDGHFLDFQDVEVDLGNGCAHTSHGAYLDIFVAYGPHLCALAIVRPDAYVRAT